MDNSDVSSNFEDDQFESQVPEVDLLKPKVTSVVANASIDIQKATGLKKLDFSVLAHKMEKVVYNGRQCTLLRFNVKALHHDKEMGGILHSNGNLNICGGLSMLMCREGMKKFTRRLGAALGVVGCLTINNFRVTNVVATMRLPRSIDVRIFKNKHKSMAEINDSFAGIKYKCENPHFTAMVFATGKVNLMGCRSVDDMPAISSKVQELTEDCLREKSRSE